MNNYIVIICSSVYISQMTPLFHSFRGKTNRTTTEEVRSPSVKVHEMTTKWIKIIHIFCFATPSRAQTIRNIPSCTKLSTAIDPATIEQYTLTHRLLSLQYIISSHFRFRCPFRISFLISSQY